MASQTSPVVLILFLVLSAAATLSAGPPPPIPISDLDQGEVQFLGKFAVDQCRFAVDQYNKYRKNGEAHLYFIEVVGGVVLDVIYKWKSRVWYLELKAVNCSHAGARELYFAQFYENIAPESEIKLKAYGSEFATGPFYKIER